MVAAETQEDKMEVVGAGRMVGGEGQEGKKAVRVGGAAAVMGAAVAVVMEVGSTSRRPRPRALQLCRSCRKGR